MSSYRDSAEARAAEVTHHLVPRQVWNRARRAATYTPGAFEMDGFIHCTNGLDELIRVANMFYKDQPGEYLALALHIPAIESDVRYDDPDEVYPHIYGPLNTSAVVGVFKVTRGADGAFLDVDETNISLVES